MNARVVVTGSGVITTLGRDWKGFEARLHAGDSGIRYMPEWERYNNLNTKLAGPVPDFSVPPHYPRKKTRTMGRVAQLATCASEQALLSAGLLDNPVLQSGATGIAYGSCTGSTEASRDFFNMLVNQDTRGVTATTYIRMMNHTAAVNIGMFFNIKGRIIPSSSACTSGSQGIGFAYEAIKYGRQTIMLAGGAEELCPTEAAVFDTLYATSTRNHQPGQTPSPFDRDRDGLVIGEGAGTLVLEDLDHAIARGADIVAEVVGFGCNSDGGHVTQPSADTMRIAMELALDDAGIAPAAIGYINAHGTATERGDIAESLATQELFGAGIAFSSLKGHLGHTLGACGAIEAWATIEMMNRCWFSPTLNLQQVDPRCADLDYIMQVGRYIDTEYTMSNNFAFGGINTSLIFKRYAP
jgi:3-oxoacyl-[acyl-carrier-protein] synthase II